MSNIGTLNSALAGRYEVDREIGAGGMATVYLARDVRHSRNVALKLLKPELGAILGVERFLAEISVTANLQHPNLLPLFDSGEADGLLFYVMPFVEGETLRARLEREKQLPVDEAVRISVAIASALAYAHAHGVIHRDLKPENILLQAGQPMIADFGIALAVSNAGGARITQTGLSLGTPQYMSPEQATGDRAIDGRTDVYSLAAMAFEMLTGDPPHSASTSQGVIAKVLTDRPRGVRTLRSSVPPHVEAAIQCALEKLPADRWAGAREFAEALQGRSTVSAPMGATHGETPRSVAARLKDPLYIVTAAVALAAIATAAVIATRRASEPAPVVRFALTPDSAAPIMYTGTWSAVPSPDGKLIAYSVATRAGAQLWVRSLDQLQGRRVLGADHATQPMFSPDGKWLAFYADNKLKKVPVEGGTPVTLADGGANNGGDWSTAHEIILGADGGFNGLVKVSDAGGKLVEFTKADSGTSQNHLWPIVLADGNTVVFTIWDGKSKAGSRLAMTTVNEGKVTNLGIAGIAPLAVMDGELLYVQADGAVMAVPIDVRGRRVTGSQIPVLDPVTVCSSCNGDAAARISRNGTLAYMHGSAASRIVWRAADGRRQVLREQVAEYASPRLSPDGRYVAVRIAGTTADVWILNVASGTLSRLTSGGSNMAPEWSPDGKFVYFASDRGGQLQVWRQPFDGSGVPERVADGATIGETSISPDGSTLLYTVFGTSIDIMSKTIGDTTPARVFIATRAHEASPRFSPDGKWVAYTSSETGVDEVYVRASSGAGGRVQISTGGGRDPTWLGNGQRLAYRSDRSMRAARLAASPSLAVVGTDSLFDVLNDNVFVTTRTWDATRDGSRFLMVEMAGGENQVVVVTNWPAEMKARIGKR